MTKATETKATVVTLKSAIIGGDVTVLANKIADLAGSVEAVQKMGLNFALAVKAAKEVVKERLKVAEELKADAATRRRESQASTLAARKELALAAAQAAKLAQAAEAEKMIKDLVEQMGYDLEVAQEMTATAMAKKYPVKVVKSFTFNRVSIDFNGEQYEMPTSGNMPTVWKERVEFEFGDDRAAFITKYAVDQETAKEVLEQKNGMNA